MDIRAEIEIIPQGSGSITSMTLPQGNNISGGAKHLSTANSGGKPFLLGASPLGGGDSFWNESKKYNGFIDSMLTNSSGDSNCEITIDGENIDSLVIRFDEVASQWPTELMLDNTIYYNDNAQFIWKGEPKQRHILNIIKWNKPLCPVRITSILIGLKLIFDRSNLQEIVRGSQSVADNSLPSYGVISQYGLINVYDRNGELKDLAELQLLLPERDVRIYFNERIIGVYKTEQCKYSYLSNIVSINLCDELIYWNDILIDSYDLLRNKTAYELFEILNAKIENVVTLNDDTLNWLQNIKITYFYLRGSTLLGAWHKLSNLSKTIIYAKQNGQVVCEKL